MTRNKLLEDLKLFCIDCTKHLEMPESVQKGDEERVNRPPEVYKMRLPDSSAAKKYAPYIIIQFVNGVDKQTHKQQSESTSLIRFIFCVYDKNEEEGSAMLLNAMDCVRIALLKKVVVGDQFVLDTDQGLETLIYPVGIDTDTAPYYAGEMIGTFTGPAIEREALLDKIY